MRLSSYTDFTLRTLMYLAVNAGRHATIAEIARAYRISETHLMKIVHQLGIAGDIETMRGRNGGLRLGKPAASINLGAVVRRTEVDMELVACFDGAATCAISEACVLQIVLHEALAAFLTVLDRYTLADLIAPRARLAVLLGIAAASGTGAEFGSPG
jgi:Rrf2 family nitric oxide-sensitive transcriptional repressor